MKNNNNNLVLLPQLIISTVLLATFILAVVVPAGYVPLPDYIQRFEGLTDREVIDAARYMYRGATFGIIYGIVNRLNGKLYIGSTSDPVTRFYEHLVSGANSNAALQLAIFKYGLECFSLVIFELFTYPIIGGKMTIRAIFELEQKYLDMFPVKQKYNFARKADGGNRPMTQEEKGVISKRMRGVNVGRAPINKGVSLTAVMKGVIRKASAHRYHQVYIYDEMMNLVTWYKSISEAVRTEHTQKNKFMAHIKNGTIWKGYTISRTPR